LLTNDVTGEYQKLLNRKEEEEEIMKREAAIKATYIQLIIKHGQKKIYFSCTHNKDFIASQ
jgi:hypothetical protein